MLMGGFLPLNLQAQGRYLEDNFDYELGDLTGKGGWASNRTSTNDLLVEDLAMTWENYATTAKAVRLPASSADKLSRQFNMDLITSGSVYYSFLLRVHDLAGTNYFIGLGQAGENVTQVFGQVAVKKNTEDATKFHIGVGRAGAPNASTEYSVETYDVAEPLLVVVKYTFVDGDKNDDVMLYAAPALSAEPETPVARNANANANDCSGMNAVMLYPAGTSMSKNAEVSISALRVSPTWEGLFATTPDVPDPAFTVTNITSGTSPVTLFGNTTGKAQFKITATNLSGDVTLVPPVKDGLAFDKTTLAKAELESAEGALVTVTMDADKLNVNEKKAVFKLQAEGLETDFEYEFTWDVIATAKRTLAEINALSNPGTSYYAVSDLVVTYFTPSANAYSYPSYYVQDATGGMKIEDGGLQEVMGRTYQIGDKLPTMIMYYISEVKTWSFATDMGEALEKNVAVEPLAVTLTELEAEPKTYLYRLVKVEDVEFFARATEGKDGKFDAVTKSYSIRQAEEQANFKAFMLNEQFWGTEIPAKAHLVGLVNSANGRVIAMRALNEMTAVTEPDNPDPDPDPDPQPGDETIAGNNLFENPGFELWTAADDFNPEGAPEEWEITQEAGAPNTEYVVEGAKSLKFTATMPDMSNFLRQEVSAQYMTGKTYRIRVPYYIQTGTATGKDLRMLSYWEGRTTNLEDHDQEVLNSGEWLTTKTGQWDTLEFKTTAPEDASRLYFRLRIARGVTVYFDNLSMYRLEKAEEIKPQILVDTKFLGTIKAFVRQADSSQYVSVSGELLTESVKVEVVGEHAAYFRPGVSQVAMADMPKTVKIHYTPQEAGFHKAELLFSSEGADTVRIALNATGQDPTARPQLKVEPETLDTFHASKPGEKQSKQLLITTMNMTGYLSARVEGNDTGSFVLSTTAFPRDCNELPLTVTYSPRRSGEHNMTLVFYCVQDNIERKIPLKGICNENIETEWIETFEPVSTELAYGDHYVNGKKGGWHLVDAVGANNPERDVFNGTRSIRLGAAGARLEMDFDLMTGIDTLRLMVAPCKDATESAKWKVETSSDFGLTWNPVGGEKTVQASTGARNVVLEIKQSGVQRLRIVKTEGQEQTASINVDDIAVTSMPTQHPTWNELARLSKENPLDLLNESFTGSRHNKPVVLEGWRNFIIKGERPWWTYQQKEDFESTEVLDYMAKATAYNSLVDEATPYEMWLVTPALNGKKTGSRLFTFRVMGDLMLENQQGGVECYFIEPFGDTMARSLIDLVMPSIPDENGEWFEYHLDMAQVEDLPEVFFIGFRFAAPGGRSNSATYYIDDVSYGREDVSRITSSTQKLTFEAMAYKLTESDEIEIAGLNLTEDIHVSVGGDHPSSFTPSLEVLPKQGGKLKVGFIAEKAGIYSAWLRFSSKGAADLYIPMEVSVKEPVPTIVVAEKDLNIVLEVKAPAMSDTSEPIVVNPFFLKEAVTLTVEGDDAGLFTLSRNSIPADGYNETFTVVFTPTAQHASGECRIRLKSADAEDVVISVKGNSNVANDKPDVLKANVWRSGNGLFHVQAAGMRELCVFSATGHLVYRDRRAADLKTVSLENKPSGLYILEIRTDHAVRRIRIVK